jgi:hypothetical protein
VNIAIPIVIVGAWLFAGVRAVLIGILRDRALDPMLVLAGVAMPLLFGLVAFAIFWASYRQYIIDRVELREFIEHLYSV